MSETTIYIPGPMHPDLFDGETPIMVPLRGVKPYRVRVTWMIPESDRISVLAKNPEEAEEMAVAYLVPDDADADNAESEVLEELTPGEVTPRMVEALRAWRKDEAA